MLKKVAILMILLAAGVTLPVSAQARDWDRRGEWRRGGHHGRYYVHHPYPRYGSIAVTLPSGYFSVSIGGHPYYYSSGVYYRRHVDRYVVVPAPVGSIVTTVPLGCRTLVVGGVTYYNDNGVYYRRVPWGYEVVPEPRVQTTVVSGEKLGISDIVVLSRAGISDDVIIAKIVDTGSTFRLSLEEVEALRREGVSSRVLNYMLNTSR